MGIVRCWVDTKFKKLMLRDFAVALKVFDGQLSLDELLPEHKHDGQDEHGDAHGSASHSGSHGQKPHQRKIVAVENTLDVHNIVVCTLCSCYPLGILGYSPAWYKSRAYRARVVRTPRKVLEEFGFPMDHLSANVKIRVHDSLSDLR